MQRADAWALVAAMALAIPHQRAHEAGMRAAGVADVRTADPHVTRGFGLSLMANEQQSTRAELRQKAATNAAAQLRLDVWIVRRYHGAQLLPDSADKVASMVTQSGAPRIEGSRAADSRDTLVALHFNAAMWKPSLAVGATALLADPSGVASKLQGRILARRAFRAPRKPGADTSNANQWRIGWVYLLAIAPRAASASPSGFDGWLLLEPPIRSRPARTPDARTRSETSE